MRKFFALYAFVGVMSTGAWAADAAAGKTVYAAKCKTCHLADGAGNAGIAKSNHVELKPLSSAEVQGLSDADLKKVITEGKGKMKPAGVTGADLDNVIAYVRTFKK